MTTGNNPGDEWENHYRGYRLQTNPDGDIWWQAYQGTDRLFLDPIPDELVESLLDIKRLGGRVRVTEDRDVLTRAESGNEYETLWVGELTLSGQLVPKDDPNYSIPVKPDELNSGDFWPSVYDGAKYSFSPGSERVWWSNPETHKRHPVRTSIPPEVTTSLARLKPRGGSFRVTPWNDVLTLVDLDQLSTDTRSQFDDLPRVVKNLIALRQERGGVEKLPIYVGQVDSTPLKIDDPPSLTDPVADDDGINDWIDSLGTKSELDPSDHTVDTNSTESEGSVSSDIDVPNDDPADW